MELNRPDVVAEVLAAFNGYEVALVAGDDVRVSGYFWDSPDVVRFGIKDHQVGTESLRAWRAAQGPLPPGRRLVEPRIATFGPDAAVVTTLFVYPAGVAVGRQSQTWLRLPTGWRIVSAHVSELPAAADPAAAAAAWSAAAS